MSNALIRTISALVLLAYLCTVVYLGQSYCALSIAILGALIVLELSLNFLKIPLVSIGSILGLVFYVIGFGLPYYFRSFELSAYVGLFFNLFLLCFLFIPNTFLKDFMEKNFQISMILFGLYVGAVMATFSGLILRPNWQKEIVLLVLTASMMDVGAWCFGKTLGKHKLWPAVSPNKTIEGLIGGIFSATVSVVLAFNYLFGQMPAPLLLLAFPILSLLSQIGDLVQSKIKRQFSIKDSSRLIPGHGGVYDRFDSYIFIIPVFFLLMKLF